MQNPLPLSGGGLGWGLATQRAYKQLILKDVRQAGFTLMELLIVMAIIALASAVIIPRISNSDGKLYQAQLRTLTAVLNYNRRKAVIINRPQNVKLYPYASKINVSQTDIGDEQQKIKIHSKKGDWKSQGADIFWQSGNVKTRNRVINLQYFPQGGATGGIITLRQGRFVANVRIDGMTGKMTFEESLLEE